MYRSLRTAWDAWAAMSFTTEMRTLIAAVVGLVLCVLSYRAGCSIAKSSAGGIVACIGGTSYIWRALSKMREGPQLDLRRYSPYTRDKVFVVTGGGRGCGLETVTLLVEMGAKEVVVACRNAQRRARQIQEAVEQRLATVGTPAQVKNLKFVELDLTNTDSVKKCGETLKTVAPKIDVLVCNAGVLLDKNAVAINWGRHVLLIENVKDICGRVVLVTSCAHGWGHIRENEVPTVGSLRTYGTSKLACLFEARYLSETYGLEAVSVHPGSVRTEMIRENRWSIMALPIANTLCKCPRSGGMTIAHCAVEPKIVRGAYYDSLRVAPVFPSASDPAEYESYVKMRSNFLMGC